MDGRGLTSRSGVAALRELADRIGLTDALGVAAAPVCSPRLVHDPGVVLRDLVVMLADGGDDFSAIETLRGYPDAYFRFQDTANLRIFLENDLT